MDFALATASDDPRSSAALIWDIRNTTAPVRRLQGHTGGVNRVSWSPADQRLLFTAGRDGKVIAWNAETGEQLSSALEASNSINEICWSPFINGALLASSSSSVVLMSFADPSIGAKTPIRNIRYHLKPSGVDVAFDGRVFSYKGNQVKSCVRQESLPESTAFGEFVQALETHDVKSFVNNKLETAETATEKEAWDVIAMSMDRDNFKEAILKKLGIEKTAIAKEIADKAEAVTQKAAEDAGESTLFGGAPSTSFEEASSVFGSMPVAQSEESLFSKVYAPFRVLPKEASDSQGRTIAQAVIAGDLQAAIDAAFQAERYADAIIIASCGPTELFEKTRQRYITKIQTPLTRIIGHVIDKDLDSFVRYAKSKDWREIFAVICNFGGESFEELSGVLGRRLIAEKSDYSSALICFVAARDYEMVQQCLFRVYETIDKMDPSSTSVILLVLEKITVIAGDKAGEVVAPLAQTFLQHILQGGQKKDALRFLDALPGSKALSELRAAIAGESRPAAAAKQQQPQGARPGKPSVYNPTANVTPSVQAPAPAPAQHPSMPNVFMPSVAAPQTAARPGAPSVYNPAANVAPSMPNVYNPAANVPSVVPTPPPPFVKKNDPSAVPPPNSGDPRQMGRQMPNAHVPPPPTIDEINNMKNNSPVPQFHTPSPHSSHGGMASVNPPPYNPAAQRPANPSPYAPPKMAQPGSNSGLPQTYTPPGLSDFQQAPSISAPPPAAVPNIIAPPSVPIITPPRIQQPVAAPPYGQPAPYAQGPTMVAPPPAAAPQINRPPSIGGMPSVIQPQVQPQQPAPQPAVVPAPVSTTATLEEVPEEHQQIAQALNQLVAELAARTDASSANKKAASDAVAKLPKAFAEFRNGNLPQEIINNIEAFLYAISQGDLDATNNARRKCVGMLSRCSQASETIRLLNYIWSALKSN